MSHTRALCFTTLFSLILSSTIAAAPARKNLTNVLEQRDTIDHRYYAEPDEEGWTHYSSVGLMLPMQERDCEVIGCEEHFATPPTLPGFQNGFQERSLSNMPASGHRDIIRRTGAVSFDNKTGEPSYVLHDHRYQHYPENDKVEAKHETPSVNPYADSSQGGHGLLSLLKRKSTISKSKRSSKTSKKGKSGKSKTGNALLSAVADVMSGATILTTITWYTGHDLLNPFCDRKSHWTPTDNSMIIAVTQKWNQRPACGEFLEITTTDSHKPRSIVARVVDLCGGCVPGVAHADLSKAAFQKLYSLDVGKVTGLKMRRVGAPKAWSNSLYGPKVL